MYISYGETRWLRDIIDEEYVLNSSFRVRLGYSCLYTDCIVFLWTRCLSLPDHIFIQIYTAFFTSIKFHQFIFLTTHASVRR